MTTSVPIRMQIAVKSGSPWRGVSIDQTSLPTAKTSSPTTFRRMRGSGRVGGPPVASPLAASNQPWWQGQNKLPCSGR